MGKGAKNRAMARRKASEKKKRRANGRTSPQASRVCSLAFPSSCLSLLSERLGQVTYEAKLTTQKNGYLLLNKRGVNFISGE